MLFRLALLAVLAFLLAACGDDSVSPVVVPTAPQPQQSQEQPQEQAASSEFQIDDEASKDAEEAPSEQPQQVSQPQSSDSDAVAADAPEEPEEQPEEQVQTGPPPPTLDHARAAAAVIELADTLGPRPSGTPEEVAAAEHIAAVLRSYGYDARLEPFEFSVEQSITQIFLSEDDDLFASRFRGSSGAAAEGPLLAVGGIGSAEDYQGLDANGAIVVVDRGQITFAEKAQHAANAGAAAIIIVNNDNTWLVGDLADTQSDIPVLGVPRIEGRNLARRAPQVVTLSPSLGEVSQSQNIVASRPDATCSVIVGAHYDTVYRTAGYNDNSSGTALMTEFARIYADHPAADQLCFVGFGAEEVGIYGSREYVRRLRESGELADVQYLLNLDAIGSGTSRLNLSVSGTGFAIGLAEQLEIDVRYVDQSAWADAHPFQQAGVATFFPLPTGGVMNTIADDASNFDADVFGDVARLAEHVLQCMLERSGAAIRPALDCGVEN